MQTEVEIHAELPTCPCFNLSFYFSTVVGPFIAPNK